MKKCINETYAVCTPNDRIMIAIFDDGSIEKEYEEHLIRDRVIERTNYCNRDRNGNRYTTTKVVNLSDIGWKKWNDDYNLYRYKHDDDYRQMCDKAATAKHLLNLAECEQSRRENKEYIGLSAISKRNNISRIKHYIELRTEEEKRMPEFQIFIDSMEKSLAILMQ